MNHQIKYKDTRKLWDRIKLIYNNIELVGNQLKSQFDSFNTTYRNIKRYYSKYFSRNPTEIDDLIHINSLKSKTTSSIYKALLEDNDFKYIELEISIYQSLTNIHHILTFDVVKLLARDHEEYFQQSCHDRKFNKLLQSINDARIVIESLMSKNRNDYDSFSESDLPFHEKLWYLYCLVEREIFSTCNLLESVVSWEKSLIKPFQYPEFDNENFPPIDYKNKQTTFIDKTINCKKSKLPKISTKSNDENLTNQWQNNLRNHTKTKQENSKLNLLISNDQSLNSSFDLKICKWNFKEPAESSRKYQPLCNKTFLIKNKKAVSKPHSELKRYLAKVSISSNITNGNERELSFIDVDLSSGRTVEINELYRPRKSENTKQELGKFNKKLSDLQSILNQLITDQENIEQIINNPLRNHVQKSLEWLKTLYNNKTNFIQTTQNEINQIKTEKSLFLQNYRKH